MLTPCHQSALVSHIGCLISVSDASYRDNFVLVGGHTVVGEQGVEDGTEDAPLWSACVCYMMLAEVLFPILPDCGLPVKKSRSQLPRIGCSLRENSL